MKYSKPKIIKKEAKSSINKFNQGMSKKLHYSYNFLYKPWSLSVFLASHFVQLKISNINDIYLRNQVRYASCRYIKLWSDNETISATENHRNTCWSHVQTGQLWTFKSCYKKLIYYMYWFLMLKIALFWHNILRHCS